MVCLCSARGAYGLVKQFGGAETDYRWTHRRVLGVAADVGFEYGNTDDGDSFGGAPTVRTDLRRSSVLSGEFARFFVGSCGVWQRCASSQ